MGETCDLCDEISQPGLVKSPTRSNGAGKWVLGLTGVSVFGIVAISSSFIAPALRKFCLPYVPATTRQVANVMQMLRGGSGKVIDLGSGDGRIVSSTAS